MNEDFRRLMEDVSYVEPGPVARAILQTGGSKRTMAKDRLQKIEGLCAWCGVAPVVDRRRKYCSPSCTHSSSISFYPQSNATKSFLLVVRQSCACARCGTCYEDQLLEKVRRVYRDWNSRRDRANVEERVTWWKLGYNTGHTWEVDHVVPIHKGGAAVGLENVQVLCVECHRRKTVEERR